MDWQQTIAVFLIFGIYLSVGLPQESSIEKQRANICDEHQLENFLKNDRSLDLPKSMAKFTQSIYLNLLKNNGSPNFVFSPLSIHSAMAMLLLGATTNSDTQLELRKALGNLGASPCVVSLLYRQIVQSYKGQGTFLYGNRIWINEDFDINREYEKGVEDYFDASIGNVNFKEPASIAMVNDWVSNITNEKITQLVEEFSPETKLFLANALYFNDKWKFPFGDKTPLGEDIFGDFKVGRKTKKVKMMELTSTELVYGEISGMGADMGVVSLPYLNKDFEMQIIVPKGRYFLEILEDGLKKQEDKDLQVGDESYFNLFLAPKNSTDFEIEDVSIKMPPFKLESKFDASGALESLGAVKIFSENAEFGRLSENLGPIGLSRVLHRAVIEVTKNGTEAAAATGVELALFSASFAENVNVIVDRAFIFIVQDKRNNIPILVGRVGDPTLIPDI